MKTNEAAIAELEKSLQAESSDYQPELSEPSVPPPPYSSIENYESGEIKGVDDALQVAEKQKGRSESFSCCRMCSAVFYVIAWICAVYLIVYFSLLTGGINGGPMLVIMILAAFLLAIAVIVCYGESCCSREHDYLKNLDNAFSIDQRLNTLRNTPPNLSLHAVAYHYETRHRTVWYTDSRGNRRSRSESYQQKVVTGRFDEVFMYTSWKDESAATIIDNINSSQVTRILMDLEVRFADPDTQAAFNQQYAMFKEKYKLRDRHVDFSESRTVVGFESRLAACMDMTQRPCWIQHDCYVIATLFFCTWPYRLMFNRATAKTNYTLVKSVQCHRAINAYPFLAPGIINTPYQPGVINAPYQPGVIYAPFQPEVINLPYAQGNAPYQQGSVVYQQGNVSYQQGSVPYQQVNERYQQEDVPYQQGNVSFQQGNALYQLGNVPYQEGNLPYHPENIPYLQGNVPNESGNLLFQQENVPYQHENVRNQHENELYK